MSRKVRMEDCKVCEYLTREAASGRRRCGLRNITLHEMYYCHREADCPVNEDGSTDVYKHQEDSRTCNGTAWDGGLGDPKEPTPIANLQLTRITKPTSAYTAELSCRLTLDQAVRAREILTYIRTLLSDVYHGRELQHPTDAHELCCELLNTAICKMDATCRSMEDLMTDDHHAQIYLV